MKMGLDLDGTIDALPWLFSILSKALIGSGAQIHIITYRDPGTRAATEADLARFGIAYTALHMPPVDADMVDWKRSTAMRLGLDLMIDDMPEVLAKIPAGVQRVWICDPEIYDLDACIGGMHAKLGRRPLTHQSA